MHLGHHKRKISPGIAECYQESKLKYVKDVFCVAQLAFVKPVTSVQPVVSTLPVGARGKTNSKTRLHPPLSDPAELDKVTDNYKLLCQSPREPLPVGALHQLMNKNAVELVRNQESLGFYNQLFLVLKSHILLR